MKRKIRKAAERATVKFTRLAVAAVVFLLLYFVARWQYEASLPDITAGPAHTAGSAAVQAAVADGGLSVHFIDVGQGDAALIVAPDSTAMLVDAGPNSAEDRLGAYLDALGITEFAYVVFTHPHEDHIGGGDMIMREYEVECVIMPAAVSTTATFERLLDAIEASGAEVICADDVLGETFALGGGKSGADASGAGAGSGVGGAGGADSDDGGASQSEAGAVFTVLGPCKTGYSELNNASVLLRLEYGGAAYLFTGDAEAEAERDLIERFGQSALRCDVLKVGHHGSVTSTTDEFLSAAAPQIAVISCAKINDYGHPHRETLEKLARAGAKIYTTADLGTIVIRTDGKSIEAVTK